MVDFHSEMAALYKQDQHQFNVKARQLIEQMIVSSHVNNQTKLRQLQWTIDAIVRKASCPLSSTIEISQMMWDKLFDWNEQLQQLELIIQQSAIHTHKLRLVK